MLFENPILPNEPRNTLRFVTTSRDTLTFVTTNEKGKEFSTGIRDFLLLDDDICEERDGDGRERERNEGGGG